MRLSERSLPTLLAPPARLPTLRVIFAIFALPLVLLGLSRSSTGREPERYSEPGSGERYSIAWADGARTRAEEILDWDRPEGNPSASGQRLFDARNPVRMVLDTRLPTGAAESFIEFVGGDRLPGRVVGFLDSQQPSAGLGPPRLLIETSSNFDLPGVVGRTRLPVALDRVRRVVRARAVRNRSKKTRCATPMVAAFHFAWPAGRPMALSCLPKTALCGPRSTRSKIYASTAPTTVTCFSANWPRSLPRSIRG